MILRAITLWPEWAWAICHLGKDVENRPARVARVVLSTVGDGWLAIHAGKHIGGRPGAVALHDGVHSLRYMAARAGVEIPSTRVRDVPTSAIVAVARVKRGNPGSGWAVPGEGHIGLYDVRTLPSPVPCSGKQGLWTVPADLSERVLAQVTP